MISREIRNCVLFPLTSKPGIAHSVVEVVLRQRRTTTPCLLADPGLPGEQQLDVVPRDTLDQPEEAPVRFTDGVTVFGTHWTGVSTPLAAWTDLDSRDRHASDAATLEVTEIIIESRGASFLPGR